MNSHSCSPVSLSVFIKTIFFAALKLLDDSQPLAISLIKLIESIIALPRVSASDLENKEEMKYLSSAAVDTQARQLPEKKKL